MDRQERALLADSLDRIIRETPADRLADALAAFGWRDVLADDAAAAVPALFEPLGRHRAVSTALDAVAALAAGVAAASVAVVHPALPSPVPNGIVSVTPSGPSVAVHGVVAARPVPPDVVLVPALLDGAPVVARIGWRGPWPASGSGMDPDAPWTTLTADLGDTEFLIDGAQRWQAMRTAAHRAVAHELYGAGRAMLDLAVAHVGTRRQFGRPIGGFQAVKHKLADVRLWQECAAVATAAAWEPADPDEAATAALVAKLVASRFTRLAREHCQQVLGGMGFTWEHDLHRYVRRVLVLEQLLGSPDRLHAELGARLRTTGVPRLAML